jgi:hypothetical protein
VFKHAVNDRDAALSISTTTEDENFDVVIARSRDRELSSPNNVKEVFGEKVTRIHVIVHCSMDEKKVYKSAK